MLDRAEHLTDVRGRDLLDRLGAEPVTQVALGDPAVVADGLLAGAALLERVQVTVEACVEGKR
jgi:hypothetical protein